MISDRYISAKFKDAPDFESLWREITSDGVVTVQDRTELEYVFNLVKGCKSYLEVGTAEGKSLYVLAHAMPDAEITYVDLGEMHTERRRNYYLGKLKNNITAIHGDSNDYSTYNQLGGKFFDVVFIDAGHEDFNVAIDAHLYGGRATKYIIFHDVQMPDVGKVFDWYSRQMPDRRAYRVVNSANYGYGIIEV